MHIHSQLPILALDRNMRRTRSLATELGLPLTTQITPPALRLEVLSGLVQLAGCLPGERAKNIRPIRSDLDQLNVSACIRSSRALPLYRAVLGRKKAQGRIVLDVTGGLGQDAWLLAAAGCSMVVVEQEPVIFALLRDGIARAGVGAQQIVRRIRLIQGRAEDVLGQIIHKNTSGTIQIRPHVVYIDPFFHSDRKKKGASKRSMQVLRSVAQRHDPEADQGVLDLAMQAALDRVVLKRPRLSSALASRHGRIVQSIQGRGHRFDVYLRL
ncbi:MAG: class I SAM-dependent methyltransferase [Desulfovermiculus sp.]